jgi:hypothetical protein
VKNAELCMNEYSSGVWLERRVRPPLERTLRASCGQSVTPIWNMTLPAQQPPRIPEEAGARVGSTLWVSGQKIDSTQTESLPLGALFSEPQPRWMHSVSACSSMSCAVANRAWRGQFRQWLAAEGGRRSTTACLSGGISAEQAQLKRNIRPATYQGQSVYLLLYSNVQVVWTAHRSGYEM